jgi:rubrerythrin
MKGDTGTDVSLEQAEVMELLRRRTTVQGWLDRIGDQEGSVSDRVLHRVREDYEGRLQEILNALSTHRQVVQEELDHASARLADAEREYSDAVDQLEEGRLRNAIGELDDDAWEERSRSLDETVRQAEDRQQSARAETTRLSEILHQLDERTVDTPSEASFEIDVVEEVSRMEVLTAEDEQDEDDDEQDEDEEEDGITAYDPESETFLQQIDRALTDQPVNILEDDSEEVEDTAPKPGLKCAECGYTNDLSAWFCGVCGADVG